MPTDPRLDEENALSGTTKVVLTIAVILALAATIVVSMFSALVALVPLMVAAIPACMLIARARRLRQASQGRDVDELESPLEGNDWYRRELYKRGRIIDDRVV